MWSKGIASLWDYYPWDECSETAANQHHLGRDVDTDQQTSFSQALTKGLFS